jgi:hypothetical protein
MCVGRLDAGRRRRRSWSMQVSGAGMLCLRVVAAGRSRRWLRSVGLGGRAGRDGAPLLTLAGCRDEGHVRFFASVPFGLLGTAGVCWPSRPARWRLWLLWCRRRRLRRRWQWLGATVSGRSRLWRPAEVGAGGVLRASDC